MLNAAIFYQYDVVFILIKNYTYIHVVVLWREKKYFVAVEKKWIYKPIKTKTLQESIKHVKFLE